ncbi:MAG: VIT1/CCC1 transporter family protein [Bryobacteraceae bacterium]
MPVSAHVEKHFTGSAVVRDIVIGMSDGLTVPFALAAGLSGAVTSSQIVVVAGLAEIAAGAIAMGLGGYLAARSDAEHYEIERKREEQEVIEKPHAEVAEVKDILATYGLTGEQIDSIIVRFQENPKSWVDWMMRFELNLEEPDPGRAIRSALTIAFSYIGGGMVPLAPYFFLETPQLGLPYSVAATVLALLAFGYIKGRFTGTNAVKSAMRMALIGGLAAGAAYSIAKAIS